MGAFHIRLENFEGPFDLLLSLISRRKLDVTEVALSQVTDEFLSYLAAAMRGIWVRPRNSWSSPRRCLISRRRDTTVTAIERLPSGEWKVSTDKGDIICEHVVSATGNFARQTGRMVGINVPVIPVEHQYIVTEAHPDIVKRKAQGLPEMGVLRESDSSWYMREEAGGLLLGPYEKGAPACYVDGPSSDSEYELFPEDLDRLGPHIETAIERVPAFGEVGVKKVYNGAIAYTPDGSPIVGPAPGVKNFWLNEGHSFGVTAAGGAGWQLAEWIVEGEPTIDMLGVDPRRFGPYVDTGYLIEKNEEAYAKVFTVHYPDEERAAARPLRQTPCYSRMKDLGAVFGSVYGWERPNWFAPQGYGLSEADLAKPDVLLNENHPPVSSSREAAREMELPPFELFPVRRRRVPKRARECRPAGYVGFRQIRGLRARRRELARIRSSPTARRRRSAVSR